jgi:hypothetical protein
MNKNILLRIRDNDIYFNDSRYKGQVITIYEAEKPKFQAGDTVQIVNSGYIYSAYRAAAIACGLLTVEENRKLKVFHSGGQLNGEIGTIVGSCKHESERKNLYGLRFPNGKTVIIEQSGLQLVNKSSYIQEDLFEI